MKKGYIVVYEDKRAVIIDESDSSIGPLCQIVTDDDQILNVRKRNLTNYKTDERTHLKKTEKQAKAIAFCERVHNIEFNGQTLADVSWFLSLFLNTAKKNRPKLYDYDEDRYDGLSSFDLYNE